MPHKGEWGGGGVHGPWTRMLTVLACEDPADWIYEAQLCLKFALWSLWSSRINAGKCFNSFRGVIRLACHARAFSAVQHIRFYHSGGGAALWLNKGNTKTFVLASHLRTLRWVSPSFYYWPFFSVIETEYRFIKGLVKMPNALEQLLWNRTV